MKPSPFRDRTGRLGQASAVIALLLVAAPGARGEEACLRPEEARADASAKFALFLERAAMICTGVLNSPAMEAWKGFRQAPEITTGLAAADSERAALYQRLYAGGDWRARWQAAESEVIDYASYLILKSDFDVAGCERLTQRLTDFKAGGWPAYSAAVDRVDFLARAKLPLCE